MRLTTDPPFLLFRASAKYLNNLLFLPEHNNQKGKICVLSMKSALIEITEVRKRKPAALLS